MNPINVLHYAVPGAELKIHEDKKLFYIEYDQIKHISTDGIDNGLIHILKIIDNTIFEPNLWNYHKFIARCIEAKYNGQIPSIEDLKRNKTKIMTMPTGIDYEHQCPIAYMSHEYEKEDKIDFSVYEYLYYIAPTKHGIKVYGLMKQEKPIDINDLI